MQGQAFGQIARADTGRVHVLQMLERGFDFFGLKFFEFGLQAGRDVGQWLGEKSGFVQIVDQGGNQGAVTQRERADNQLIQQMFAQAGP